MNLERLLYTARTYRWLAHLWRFPLVDPRPLDRPIFLLGTQGGGLSLLSRMLRRHPACVSGAGNSDYWTSSDEIANIYGLLLPARFAGLRFKAPDHPVLKAPRSWTYACDELIDQYRGRAEDATRELEQQLLRVINFALTINRPREGRARFVDKSQTTTVRVGLFQALLAGCSPKFVLVPRDPYVSVYRAANGKAGDMQRLQGTLDYRQRVEICSQHFVNSMRAAFDDADAAGTEILVVKFEDLLQDPEIVLAKICRFVELGFRTDMLPQRDHVLPKGSRFRDRWFPVRKGVNDPYRDRIEDFVYQNINERGADIVTRLGYELKG